MKFSSIVQTFLLLNSNPESTFHPRPLNMQIIILRIIEIPGIKVVASRKKINYNYYNCSIIVVDIFLERKPLISLNNNFSKMIEFQKIRGYFFEKKVLHNLTVSNFIKFIF